MPTYASPRRVEIVLVDDDGSKRVAVAERHRGNTNLPRWDLALNHPSGRSWPGTFSGANVGDALFEFLARKEGEYYQERGRGHRPQPNYPDRNAPVDEAGAIMRANITTQRGNQVAFGRAAAAAARERNGGGS